MNRLFANHNWLKSLILLLFLTSPITALCNGDYLSIRCEIQLLNGKPGTRIRDRMLVAKLKKIYEGHHFVADQFYFGHHGGVVARMLERTNYVNIVKPVDYESALEVLSISVAARYLGPVAAVIMGFGEVKYQSYKTAVFIVDELELNAGFSKLRKLLGDETLFPIRYVSNRVRQTPRGYLYGLAILSQHPVSTGGYLRNHDLSSHWTFNLISKEAILRMRKQVALLLQFSDWVKKQPEAEYWNEERVLTKESRRIDFSSYNWVVDMTRENFIVTQRVQDEAIKNINLFMHNGDSPAQYLRHLMGWVDSRNSRTNLAAALDRFLLEHPQPDDFVRLKAEDVWTSMLDVRNRLLLLK